MWFLTFTHVEIVPERVLVPFQAEQCRFDPVSEHFFVPELDHAKHFH